MTKQIDYTKATFILGFRATRPPNPKCCSDTGNMCPMCVAKALAANGYTTNQKQESISTEAMADWLLNEAARLRKGNETMNLNDLKPIFNEGEDEDMAPPTIDWNDLGGPEKAQQEYLAGMPPNVRSVMNDALTFTKAKKALTDNRRSTRFADEDSDMAPPTINYAKIASPALRKK